MQKNNFIHKFRSKIKIEVRGKNVERFIRKLSFNNIELLDIKYPKRNVINLLIYKDDYEKTMKLKSIYEIDVVDAKGLIKIKSILKVNKILLLFLMLGIGVLIFLTNIIFKIEIVHTSSEVRKFLINELKSYGVDTYSLKKNFKEIQYIKNEILNKYPDKIEWLEIETIGVKYVVRVELREIIEKEEDNLIQNVVAKKDALIKKVTAKSGMIVKNVNDYVKKGDIIINANINLNNERKGVVNAKGEVYGEVWYTTTVEYPFNYYEERLTGKYKNVISFKFLNKSIDFFSPYKDKKTTSTIILQSNLLPIKLVKEKQEQLIVIDQILTEEEAIDKGLELAYNKMKNHLQENEHIINSKILKVNIKNNKLVLDVFFVVYENITDYSEVANVEENTNP